ncbi:hypothetical protein [Sutcliffiella horikoshii]|uniref:hypothetical protein n=1 Tax=Sutcliffiella horikoshii TaxID=79883 RepID=UPI001F39D682|nr:hypothetical protein [Sutcliffiella horikoshii]MCG1022100.1 hypothetical protein [Sutcliffiella horikoshii]
MKKNNLITFGLIVSIILNLVLFQNIYNNKEESRLAHFEEVHNGIRYSYDFGDTLSQKYNRLTLDEKVEYLTAMHWSLTLSAWTLEDIKPDDKEYSNLVNLLSIYSHIPTELKEMIRKNYTEEEVLDLLNIWLKDINKIIENFNYIQLSKVNDKELLGNLKSLLNSLEYNNESLEQYKQSLN